MQVIEAAYVGKSSAGIEKTIPAYSMTRGDTEYFSVELLNDDGTAYTLAEGDVLYMTARKQPKENKADTNWLFQIRSNTLLLKLTPEDTEDGEYGAYHFDIELRTADGDVFTVMKHAILYLEEEYS